MKKIKVKYNWDSTLCPENITDLFKKIQKAMGPINDDNPTQFEQIKIYQSNIWEEDDRRYDIINDLIRVEYKRYNTIEGVYRITPRLDQYRDTRLSIVLKNYIAIWDSMFYIRIEYLPDTNAEKLISFLEKEGIPYEANRADYNYRIHQNRIKFNIPGRISWLNSIKKWMYIFHKRTPTSLQPNRY